MRVLMRFEKNEQVKYISHLDMQRLFQRALRRAKLPCAYSKGFNPHLLISFACALPVGVCSKAEYVEIQLEKFVHPSDVMHRINEVLPTGVRVLNAVELNDAYPNVGSVIALAEYNFIPHSNEDFSAILKSFSDKSELIITKKTKKGMAEVNILPMIHRLKQENGVIKATLTCSNSENLRGDKMAEILCAEGIKIIKTERTALFIMHNGFIKEPLETTI